MIEHSVTHVYHHAWDVVTEAFMRRFPTNSHMPFLLGTEVLEQRVDPDTGVEVLVQYVRIDIQAPMWIKRMTKTYTFCFHMTIEKDSKKRWMRTVSKNETFPGAMAVHEETVFTVDANNDQHTHLSQRGSLDVLRLPGLGFYIEKYSMKSYTKNAARARQIDELFIAEVYADRKARGLPAPEADPGKAPGQQRAALGAALARETAHFSFAELGPVPSAPVAPIAIPEHRHHEDVEVSHSARGRHQPLAAHILQGVPGRGMPRARSTSYLPAAEAASAALAHEAALLPSSGSSACSEGPEKRAGPPAVVALDPPAAPRSPWLAGRPAPHTSLGEAMGRESLELPPPLSISVDPPDRNTVTLVRTPTGRSRPESPVPDSVFVSRPLLFRTSKYHLEPNCSAARRARAQPAEVIARKSLSPCPQCAGHVSAELDAAIVYTIGPV